MLTSILLAQNAIPSWAKIIHINLVKYEEADNYFAKLTYVANIKGLLLSSSFRKQVEASVAASTIDEVIIKKFEQQVIDYLDSSPATKAGPKLSESFAQELRIK